MSALFDFPSLLIIILLLICSATYTRTMRPEIFNDAPTTAGGPAPRKHSGFVGIAWKASRVGERISEYVAGGLLISAFYVLFVK